MRTTHLLLFLPVLTFAYNLEVENAMIYTAPSTHNRTNQNDQSFFGYSVLLYSKRYFMLNPSSIYESWMIVGAPKANYSRQTESKSKIPEEPGVAYSCQLPGNCVPINVMNPEDQVTFVNSKINTSIIKEHGWFGAAMSLYENSDLLTVCAPRTTLVFSDGAENIYEKTMHGTCYNGRLPFGNLYIEDKHFLTYNFASTYWINPLNGFAVHYPRLQTDSEPVSPVIGSPVHELAGTLHKMGQHQCTKLPNYNSDGYLSLFGFALSSGNYFRKLKLMVAGGAPEWEYMGQVAIMDYRSSPLSVVSTINGTEIGEFFGASLATGDMNNDGLDDLIVGAPHWKNDNGRVYIFLGKKDGFFEADILLEGSVNDALYGYAVTSGDLDSDGFDDLIVAAPWEESGVIYVYNGGTELQKLDSIKESQRIAASSISSDILRFGFSLSKPVDVDGNGFPDLAVGAYASGHALLIRSKPVVKTTITISTIPSILLRNSTSFLLKLCLNQYPIYKTKMWNGLINVTLDKHYKRVNTHDIEFRIIQRLPGACVNKTIQLQKKIRNYVDDIEVVANHKFLYLPRLDDCTKNITMGSLCPVGYKEKSATARKKLSFDIGCGTNRTCQSFIFAKLKFRGLRNSTWIIGSDALSLAIIIGNNAQPAYMTTVTFNIPKGIFMKSILPSCHEEGDRQALRVTCDVGNPLKKSMQKNISLDFDIDSLRNASVDGTKLNFTVDIKTLSANQGASAVAISLQFKANVSIALSGKAYNDTSYFGYNEKPSNFAFQHNYQISRFGVTPISEVLLKISVPYKLGGSTFLTIAHKPRVSVLGRFHECSVSDVSISKQGMTVNKLWTEAGIEDHLHTTASRSRSRGAFSKDSPTTSISKPDEIPHTTIVKSDTSQLQCDENIQAQLCTKSNTEDIIYLNCSTPNIICGQITCKIPFLNTAYDVGRLPVRLVADISKLTGYANEGEKIIHFATEASVQVLNPKMPFNVPGAGNAVPLTTTFRRTPNLKNEYSIFVNIWKKYDRTSNEIGVQIVLGSILLGLLILGLIAVALRSMGFFERKKREELKALASEEATPINVDRTSGE